MSADPISLPLRHHHIRAILRSPAHYLAVRRGQAFDDPTQSMERGSGLHAMLSGVPVLTWEEGRPRRGKDYDAFVGANPGALVLAASDYALATAMHAAVMADPVAGPLLRRPGKSETSILWDEDGIACRTTPDLVLDDGMTIVEVKTTRNADPVAFLRSARRDYGYHTQAAWHARGLRRTTTAYGGVGVYVVAIESVAPHVTTTIRVSPGMLAVADDELDHGLDLIRACRVSDEYPGYTPAPVLWAPDDGDMVVT